MRTVIVMLAAVWVLPYAWSCLVVEPGPLHAVDERAGFMAHIPARTIELESACNTSLQLQLSTVTGLAHAFNQSDARRSVPSLGG